MPAAVFSNSSSSQTVSDIVVESANNISETISLYPNPVNNGKVFISNWSGLKTVDIYDITGKLLLSTQIEKELNVSTLPQGIFIIEISQDDKFAIKKLIIQK